jgi:hypothetical protein
VIKNLQKKFFTTKDEKQRCLKNVENPILIFTFLGELGALGGSNCLSFWVL